MSPEIKVVANLSVVAIACLVFARAVDTLLTHHMTTPKAPTIQEIKSAVEATNAIMDSNKPRRVEQIESDIANLREHLASKEVIPDRTEKEMALRDLGTELNLAWTGLVVGKIRHMDSVIAQLTEQLNATTQKYIEAENIIAELVTRVGALEDKQ